MPQPPAPKRHPYDQWSPDARALDVVGDKWTLLIVRDLVPGPRRFVEIQRSLPGISTEQLRTRLARMVAAGLLTRTRFREAPPRVNYELTERSLALVPVLGALADWGRDHAWGAPRRGERVDLPAIFRLAPAVMAPARGVRGTVALTAPGASGRETYVIGLRPKGTTIAEGSADGADAAIAGDRAAWVAAIGPRATRSKLKISGDRKLAAAVLDALAG